MSTIVPHAMGAARLWYKSCVRVVMVGTFGMRPKGTMRSRALPMARALVASGRQVRMVVPPWDYPPDAGRREEVDGVEIVYCDVPPRLGPLSYARISLEMLRQTRRFRPDVLHCFKPKGFGGLVAGARALLPGTRVVVDADDWEGAGGWNDVGAYSSAQRRVFAFQESRLLGSADAVTVASQPLLDMVSARRSDGVFYVPNAVYAQPEISSAARTGPTILLYTRFVEFQPERAAVILAGVLAQVPDARLVLFGAGLRGEESDFLRAAQNLGVRHAIEHVVWDPAVAPAIFARSTVAMFPFDDTLINRAKSTVKLLEVMAHGIPVVAEAVGQNCAVIEPGRSGLLVASGDTGQFVQCIVEVLRDPALRDRLGAGGRDRIANEFTWDTVIRRVEAAYCT